MILKFGEIEISSHLARSNFNLQGSSFASKSNFTEEKVIFQEPACVCVSVLLRC